jgi:putative ABC transport system permease protein
MIVSQLLLETVITALAALGLSLFLVISGKGLISTFLSPYFSPNLDVLVTNIPYILLVALFIGLSAGMYPAVLLIRSNTTRLIKGGLSKGVGPGLRLRHSLLFVQILISQGLIIASLIVNDQLGYLQSKSLGFDKENLVYFKLHSDDMTNYYQNIKNSLLNNPRIIAVSQSERLVGEPWPVNSIQIEGNDAEELHQVKGNLVDYDFLETLGIRLTDGRFFSERSKTDSTQSIVINQLAAQQLGFADPIGKRVHFLSSTPRTIIGVVEDFNFNSLHESVGPMALVMPFVVPEFMMVRLQPGNLVETLESIQQSWTTVAPDVPFEFEFVDSRLNQLYISEKNLSSLMGVFTVVAIILACIGMFSIVSYISQKRQGEISIHKVFGATIRNCFFILSKSYLKITIISSIAAFPLMIILMRGWLNAFAYKISIGPEYFLGSFLIMILLTLVSISYIIMRTALVNPADLLRNE